LVLLVSGCGHSRDDRTAVSPSEWKAVVRDSYDGRIDKPHRCAAVREAFERIPHDVTGSSIPDLLLAYEKRVC
jgi:hypothetical protein